MKHLAAFVLGLVLGQPPGRSWAFSFSRRPVIATALLQARRSSRLEGDETAEQQQQQQQRLLAQQGEREAELLATAPNPPTPLVCYSRDIHTQQAAATLAREGLVGLAQVLPDDDDSVNTVNCQKLRDYILDYRRASQAAVDQQQIPRQARFAKCLLSAHRDDLLLPLTTDEPPEQALRHILTHTAVGPLIEEFLGPDATLFELAALISHPGSARQNIHPDHACGAAHNDDDKPLVLTCFVALQAITPVMGPTLWFPRTHTSAMHAQFQRRRVEDVWSDASPRDTLLRTTPAVVGAPLSPGAAAVFDSRLLHAGTAHTSPYDDARVLFYVSFRRRGASVGREGGSLGYGLDRQALTVEDLVR
jgi:ectoine hydroxylase-related dioxygenase (phytanoyl-CoA dioxygenase family)